MPQDQSAAIRATEKAVTSHMAELSVTEAKLTDAKKKHRDLLNNNIVYRTLSKAKGLASSRGDRPQGSADHILVPSRRKHPEAGPGPEGRPLSFSPGNFHKWPGAVCRVVQ
jgi:hypothetical protein